MHLWMDGGTINCICFKMGRWMDGWMDEWMNIWMEGWGDRASDDDTCICGRNEDGWREGGRD